MKFALHLCTSFRLDGFDHPGEFDQIIDSQAGATGGDGNKGVRYPQVRKTYRNSGFNAELREVGDTLKAPVLAKVQSLVRPAKQGMKRMGDPKALGFTRYIECL